MNFTNEHSVSPNLDSNVTYHTTISSNIYFSVYVINAFFGIPVNSYVLWLICTGKGSGILAEFFSLNLTVCDLLFGLNTLVFVITYYIQGVTYYINYFSVALPSTGRPLINCAICIERYLAVLHPVTFLKYKPLRYRLACSAVIWLIVFGFGIFCTITISSNNLYMFTSIYAPQFAALLCAKLVCCISIVRALKCPGPGDQEKKRIEANQMKKKAIRFILILTGTMIVQYSPIICIGFLYSTLSEAGVLLSISISVFIIFGFVNPIFYMCRIRNL